MAKGNCQNCLYWEDGLCDKRREATIRTASCKEWISRDDMKEKEKLQLANSYVPNAWDEWKKKALQAENQKSKNWEICDESYSELKTLIEGCGCLIHKGDPRLDTSHPLTYDDLQQMPGQPIWHSNTDQWALVAEEPQYADRVTVWHSDGTITNISREDAIAMPWYRMKVQNI